MHFGENQLSRSLIGLSPLPTAHPLSFQPKWVRASTTSYRRFTLAMGRSLRFGSRPRDYIPPIQTRFRYAYPTRVNLAPQPLPAGSFFKRPAITHRRLWRLVGTRFQVLFPSPPGVLFIFPSRYSSAIGLQEVFRLTGWSRQIHSKFHELAATREHQTNNQQRVFAYGALTHSGRPSQDVPLTRAIIPRTVRSSTLGPTTPPAQPLTGITCKRF